MKGIKVLDVDINFVGKFNYFMGATNDKWELKIGFEVKATIKDQEPQYFYVVGSENKEGLAAWQIVEGASGLLIYTGSFVHMSEIDHIIHNDIILGVTRFLSLDESARERRTKERLQDLIEKCGKMPAVTQALFHSTADIGPLQ